MTQRPLYGDYIRQFFQAAWGKGPIISNGRVYTFTDRKLVLLCWLLIIPAICIIYNYSPYSLDTFEWPAINIAADFGILFFFAYWFYFAWRFSLFSVRWADLDAHPHETACAYCDKYGNYVPEHKNRRVLWRSRKAFLLLALSIAGVTLGYCFLGYGLAPYRLFQYHKTELNKLVEIANRYDDVYIHTDWMANGGTFVDGGTIGPDSPEHMPVEDRQAILRIMDKLRGNYIRHAMRDTRQDTYFWMLLAPKGRPFSVLVWYPGAITAEQVAEDQIVKLRAVTQLDEHWWQVWD